MLVIVSLDRIKRYAVSAILCGSFLLLVQLPVAVASTANVSWNPSTDPNAVGYTIYYGTTSHVYTNSLVVGNVTNATVSGLTPGVTYYFAATTDDSAGSESAFSGEATYTVPQALLSQPPTLDPISILTLNENAQAQTVNLSGITSGSTNQNQSLIVTATSSNPLLIPAPVVNYSSPATTGTLTLQPAANAAGTATITVTVNNGGASNNLVSQSFTVTVNPVPTLNPIANLTLNENVSAQTVSLSGITSGTTNSNLALAVTATSSNPSLIPTPVVNYASPSSTGSLILQPAANATGAATITVTVINGGSGNNQFSQSFTVTVNSSLAPVITQPLTNIVAVPGQNVTLSVTATGQGRLKYLWTFNGAKLSNSGSSLTLHKVSTANSGIFSVTVSNNYGSASSTASLTVGSQGTANDTPVPALPNGFNFTVAGITDTNYAVEASSDLVNWTALQTNVAPFVFVDTNSSQFSQRFYRMVQVP